MIHKTKNVLLDKELDRIVTYEDGWTQITINDQRYYCKNKEYYPSVTYILSVYPKGKYFENWIKAKGEAADDIAQEAAAKGTAVHKAIELMLQGHEPKWIEENGYINYSFEEWLMVLRFAEFWNKNKPKLIKSEFHIFSDNYKYAGTIDLVLEIDKKLWIVDIKTSNAVHTIHELQLSSYAIAWNEHFPDQPISNVGILWLKSNTRKPDKQGEKLQGKGWQLKTFDRGYAENFEIFKKVYDIFKIENPILKPVTEIYPNNIKLDLS